MQIYMANTDDFIYDYAYWGTYLHGQFEKNMGYDIFSFSEQTNFNDGIHHVKINGIDCIFILWTADDSFYEKKGYLIYKSDVESLSFCLDRYIEKAMSI